MLREYEELIFKLKQNKNLYKEAEKNQLAVWNGEKPDVQPLLLNCHLDGDDGGLIWHTSKEIHFDPEKMLYAGLNQTLMPYYGGAQAVPSVRADMGCGIFPTLFGVKQELFDDKMPWVINHLPKEELKSMTSADLKIGHEFRTALEHMEYMAEALKDSGVYVYPLDLQGAFDIAHIVYGDDIFYDLYDDPGFVHHLMNLSVEAVFIGMDEVLKRIPESDKVIAHYNGLVMPRKNGGIKLSEDTSTLLSREHINEFVIPYLNKILSRFNGGYVHYCGCNPHLLGEIMKLPLVRGINFGNPEKHDMTDVLKRCAKENKVYYGSIPETGKSLTEYFDGYYEASLTEDGRSILLLTYSCPKNKREKVYESWTNAVLKSAADNKKTFTQEGTEA